MTITKKRTQLDKMLKALGYEVIQKRKGYRGSPSVWTLKNKDGELKFINVAWVGYQLNDEKNTYHKVATIFSMNINDSLSKDLENLRTELDIIWGEITSQEGYIC